MSRIQKYKESLHRFIKDKTGLMDNNDVDGPINSYLYDKIINDDLIFPILLLTIMNNQNKKNNITMQGYNIASSLEFLNILIYCYENKTEIVKLFNTDIFNKMVNKLTSCAYKTLQQNYESIKNTYSNQAQTLVNIMLSSLSVFNDTIQIISSSNNQLDVTVNNCHHDIVNWYLKNDTNRIALFRNLKQIDKKSMLNFMYQKYQVICESAMILGWIIGGGDIKLTNRIKKTAKSFSTIYKMSIDFNNIITDIDNDKYRTNYVVNYGLQEGYETFLTAKEQFIEDSMLNDIFTNTIREILSMMEENIDSIIDQTSPDLKSSYESKK